MSLSFSTALLFTRGVLFAMGTTLKFPRGPNSPSELKSSSARFSAPFGSVLTGSFGLVGVVVGVASSRDAAEACRWTGDDVSFIPAQVRIILRSELRYSNWSPTMASLVNLGETSAPSASSAPRGGVDVQADFLLVGVYTDQNHV